MTDRPTNEPAERLMDRRTDLRQDLHIKSPCRRLKMHILDFEAVTSFYQVNFEKNDVAKLPNFDLIKLY